MKKWLQPRHDWSTISSGWEATRVYALYLIDMSALYFLPLTMPSSVGVWLSWKLRVTSYTADTTARTVEKNRFNGKLGLGRLMCVCVLADVRYLCLSDTAAWWWSLWSAAAGGIWALAGLYSPPPACWSGASSPWSGFPRNTAGTAQGWRALGDVHTHTYRQTHITRGFGDRRC